MFFIFFTEAQDETLFLRNTLVLSVVYTVMQLILPKNKQF